MRQGSRIRPGYWTRPSEAAASTWGSHGLLRRPSETRCGEVTQFGTPQGAPVSARVWRDDLPPHSPPHSYLTSPGAGSNSPHARRSLPQSPAAERAEVRCGWSGIAAHADAPPLRAPPRRAMNCHHKRGLASSPQTRGTPPRRGSALRIPPGRGSRRAARRRWMWTRGLARRSLGCR